MDPIETHHLENLSMWQLSYNCVLFRIFRSRTSSAQYVLGGISTARDIASATMVSQDSEMWRNSMLRSPSSDALWHVTFLQHGRSRAITQGFIFQSERPISDVGELSNTPWTRVETRCRGSERKCRCCKILLRAPQALVEPAVLGISCPLQREASPYAS